MKKGEDDKWFDNVIDTHETMVSLLRKGEINESTADYNEYDRQIQHIAELISETKDSFPLASEQFYSQACTYLKKLKESKTLEATTAQISGEANAKEAGDNDCGARNWFDRVNAYLNRAKSEAMSNKAKEYSKDMKAKSEKFKEKPKEEQTPELFIETVLKMANLILRGALELSDTTLKEQGIALGLEGMALLLKANISSVFEVAALKIMFFELNLMEILKEEKIYSYFDDCWYILYCLAHNGFRVPTMEFDFWPAAKYHLDRKEFTGDFYRKSYSKMLLYLEEMTDPDASRCVPQKGGHCEEYFSGIAIDQIAFDYEKECTEDIKDIVMLTARQPTTAVTKNEQFRRLPTTWFEKSEYAKRLFESEEERRKNHEMVIGALSCGNFEILYHTIAMHFAKTVVITPALRTTLHDGVSDIGKIRLLMWQHVAGLAKGSLSLCLSLYNNVNLLEFAIESYILPDEPTELFPRALRLLCQLRHAEYSHRHTKEMKSFVEGKCVTKESEQNNSNVHCLSDFDKNRLDLATKWTYTELRSLESNVVGKLIPYFCEKKHSPRETESLLVSLHTFLEEENDDTNYSENFYVARRLDLLECVIAHFEESTEALERSAKDEENAESHIHRLILRHGCGLINLMMAIFYRKDRMEKNFFADRLPGSPLRSSKIFLDLIRAAGRMLQFLPRTNERNNLRQNEDLMLHWSLQFYCLLMNLASDSGVSHTDVLVKYGDNVGGIDQDELEKIIYGVSKFKKVDVTVYKRMHHKLVIVASDLLLTEASAQVPAVWNGFFVMESNLKAKIIALKARLIQADTQKKEYTQWLYDQEQRRKRAKCPPVVVTSFQPTNRPEIQIVQFKYAISEVSYYSPGTQWRCTTSSPDFEDIKEEHMKQGRDEGAAAACAFLICNNVKRASAGPERAEHPFTKLLRLLDKLNNANGSSATLEKLKLNLELEVVKTILSLRHAIDLLLNCGYYFTNEDAKKFLTVTPDSIRSSYIKELHKTILELKEEDMQLRLCSRFMEVDEASVETLEEEQLPLAFFCKKTHKHYDSIHRLPIRELRSRRPRLDKVPRNLRYVLVRVTVGTKCFQAVFNPEQTVARVLTGLREGLGVRVPALREKNSNENLPETKELGDFPYVVHLLIGLP